MLKLGRGEFEDTALLVMAIVNRTRDSFYDNGATWDEEPALDRVRQVVAEGADLVDIGGVKAGPGEVVDTAEEIRRTAPCVARVRAEFPDLVISVDTWRAEVARESVLIDPAHDFDKNTWHSLELTRRLDEMTATGWPVLVSLSNKDFVGETLDRPVGERLVGTLAATAVSAWHGARVYRVHEVAETRQVLDMVASIRGTRPPARVVRGLA